MRCRFFWSFIWHGSEFFRNFFLRKWFFSFSFTGWSSLCDTWEHEDNILDPSLIRAFELDESVRKQRSTRTPKASSATAARGGARKRGRPPRKNAVPVIPAAHPSSPATKNDTEESENSGNDQDNEEPPAKRPDIGTNIAADSVTNYDYSPHHAPSYIFQVDSEGGAASGVIAPASDNGEQKRPGTVSAHATPVTFIIKDEENEEASSAPSSASPPRRSVIMPPPSPVLLHLESSGTRQAPAGSGNGTMPSLWAGSLAIPTGSGGFDQAAEVGGIEFTQVTSQGFTVTFEETRSATDFLQELWRIRNSWVVGLSDVFSAADLPVQIFFFLFFIFFFFLFIFIFFFFVNVKLIVLNILVLSGCFFSNVLFRQCFTV